MDTYVLFFVAHVLVISLHARSIYSKIICFESRLLESEMFMSSIATSLYCDVLGWMSLEKFIPRASFQVEEIKRHIMYSNSPGTRRYINHPECWCHQEKWHHHVQRRSGIKCRNMEKSCTLKGNIPPAPFVDKITPSDHWSRKGSYLVRMRVGKYPQRRTIFVSNKHKVRGIH